MNSLDDKLFPDPVNSGRSEETGGRNWLLIEQLLTIEIANHSARGIVDLDVVPAPCFDGARQMTTNLRLAAIIRPFDSVSRVPPSAKVKPEKIALVFKSN